MANPELDELRAKLLAKGVTAPKSWSGKKLAAELAKTEQSEQENNNPEQESSNDESKGDSNESTNEPTGESTEQSDTQDANPEQESSKDESTDESSESMDENTEDLDETSDDAEVLDDKVSVKAKTAFSNPRLNLNNIKIGKTLTVSSEDAKFLVETDRTCEYVND